MAIFFIRRKAMENKQLLDDELDNVTGGRLNELAQRTNAIEQKADMVAQKNDLLEQKTDMLNQKVDVLMQKTDMIDHKLTIKDKGLFKLKFFKNLFGRNDDNII